MISGERLGTGLCPGGKNEADHGLEVPADWGRAADLVARGEVRRVLVVGPPDVGKSSLCRVILAGAAPRRAVALLDGDVGQKIIGPPACVTLGRSSPGQGLALCALAFVGTTEPVCGWRRVIEGLHRLTAQAGPEVVVVNTGGLLSGPGDWLKKAKIEVLVPDLVISLGRHPTLDALGPDSARLRPGDRSGQPSHRQNDAPHARSRRPSRVPLSGRVDPGS